MGGGGDGLGAIEPSSCSADLGAQRGAAGTQAGGGELQGLHGAMSGALGHPGE